MTHTERDAFPSRDDYKDAVGWLIACHRGDTDARSELASVVDPCGLVDALTLLLLGLARLSTGGEPEAYLNHMVQNIDRYCDDLDWLR